MEQKLQTVQMPRIQHEYLNVSKVASYITAGVDLNSGHRVTTLPTRGNQKTIKVLVSFAEDEHITTSQQLTLYDLAVLDSVYTLYVNQCTAFSPEMVVRAMSGNLSQDVTSTKRDRVVESLDRLSRIQIMIDCTDEFRARGKIKAQEKICYQSYLLPLEKVCITLGNQKTLQGYHLIKVPALYQYAAQINQIASVPAEVFAAGHISATEEVILIRRYLIRRIEAMRNKRNRVASKRISYEWHDAKTTETKGMFSAFGYKNKPGDSTWRTKKARFHRAVTSILDGFKSVGYIKDYETVRDRQSSILGVEIEL